MPDSHVLCFASVLVANRRCLEILFEIICRLFHSIRTWTIVVNLFNCVLFLKQASSKILGYEANILFLQAAVNINYSLWFGHNAKLWLIKDGTESCMFSDSKTERGREQDGRMM